MLQSDNTKIASPTPKIALRCLSTKRKVACILLFQKRTSLGVLAVSGLRFISKIAGSKVNANAKATNTPIAV